MGLGVRRRKIDSKDVQSLFDLHKLLNHGGRHWIKGRLFRRVKGVGMCYCLEGGINKVVGYRYSNRKYRLMDLVLAGIRRHNDNRRLSYPATTVTSFNDHSRTKWEDVETVIRYAIEEGRNA